MIQHEHWSKDLKRLGVICHEPINWAGTMPDPQTAWSKCDDPSWMLWITEKLCGKRGSARHRQVVLATCACVRLVLPCVPRSDGRPRRAIELTEAWARRKQGVTLMMLRRAAGEAYDAAEEAYDVTDAAAAAFASSYIAYIATCDKTISYAAATYDDLAVAAEYAGITPRQFNANCTRIIRRMLPDVPKWFEEYKL